MFVDGRQEYDLMYTKGASYQWVTYSVFLEAGSHEVTIKPDWGWMFFRDLKVKCTGLRKTSADTLAECDATTSNGINSYRHTDDSTLLINPDTLIGSLGRDVYGWESVGMFEVNQLTAPTPDTPGDSGTHGGTHGGTADGNGSGTGTEAKPDRKPDSAVDKKGDAGADSESDGKWHMPTNPRKRRALVQTGYTAGGLTAGIVAAGVVAMIARAARRRHQ